DFSGWIGRLLAPLFHIPEAKANVRRCAGLSHQSAIVDAVWSDAVDHQSIGKPLYTEWLTVIGIDSRLLQVLRNEEIDFIGPNTLFEPVTLGGDGQNGRAQPGLIPKMGFVNLGNGRYQQAKKSGLPP